MTHPVTPAQIDLFAAAEVADSALPLAEGPTPAERLAQFFDQAVAAGWLRRLDVALARFLAELDATVAPSVQWAAALLAQMEGRGHSCLLLSALWRAEAGAAQGPQAALAAQLGWPAAAAQALDALAAPGEAGDGRPVWPTEPSDWLAALRASPTVREAESGAPDTGQPLVLAGAQGPQPRLYLRRYWSHEQQVAAQLRARGAPLPSDAPDAVPEATLRSWLDRLFPAAPPPADGGAPAPDWQKLACAVALRGRLGVITGGPGTGKTYTAARLLALLLATAPEPERLRVALAAPTGKAAARLKQSIDSSLLALQDSLNAQGPGAPDLAAFVQRMGAARTLHALLGARPDTRALRHHAAAPLDVDVLIVDEASMVHLEMMSGLLAALPAQARLILLGDKDQLASVEAGAVLGDVCHDAERGAYSPATAAFAEAAAGVRLPPALCQPEPAPPLAQLTVMLRVSRRFEGEIGDLAAAVNRGDVAESRRVLREARGQVLGLEGVAPAELLRLVVQGRQAGKTHAPGYRAYGAVLREGPADATEACHRDWVRRVLTAFDHCRVLCAVRQGDWGSVALNRTVAQALSEDGCLRAEGEWYAGRPVMVTRNDPALGVFNGDIGIALPAWGGRGLRVWFADGERLRPVSPGRLSQVETAFAMTVHKSQGSEFRHAVLVLPEQAGPLLSRELVYTGITRAREAFTLVSPQAAALDTALAQPTRRASGLVDALTTRLPDASSNPLFRNSDAVLGL